MEKRKFLINIFLIYSIIAIIIWLNIEGDKDKKIENESQIANYTLLNVEVEEKDADNKIVEIKQYPKESIIQEFRGYLVSAKLEIPAISLTTYVLKNYSVQALNVSVAKFWGANPNQIGNFCIAGHNFKNKLMFRNLKNLNLGDRLFISDNDVGKVEYKIYDLYKVLPNNVSCLAQETNGKREVTLITCTNDSKERIIVKGREVE